MTLTGAESTEVAGVYEAASRRTVPVSSSIAKGLGMTVAPFGRRLPGLPVRSAVDAASSALFDLRDERDPLFVAEVEVEQDHVDSAVAQSSLGFADRSASTTPYLGSRLTRHRSLSEDRRRQPALSRASSTFECLLRSITVRISRLGRLELGSLSVCYGLQKGDQVAKS